MQTGSRDEQVFLADVSKARKALERIADSLEALAAAAADRASGGLPGASGGERCGQAFPGVGGVGLACTLPTGHGGPHAYDNAVRFR